MKKISICIPTYEMHGKAIDLLSRAFKSIKEQTYKNFETIISDNSEDDVIKEFCEKDEFKDVNIKYFKNPRKGMAQNTNESMKKAQGDLIKILYMDDFFAHKDSLKDIQENFNNYWLVSACEHIDEKETREKPHIPRYNKKIYLGKNTIGSPSVLTIKNENLIFFDEEMTWLLDCDYYKRLFEIYGEPTILKKINIVIGKGNHQTTNHLTESRKKSEYLYMKNKYKSKLLKFLNLW